VSSVSVVIPVHNATSTLGSQLEALANQDCKLDFEVIIADNRSTDDLPALLARYSDRLPGLRSVEAFERKGVCYARNVGTRAASGDLILGCDGDDVVDSGWVSGLIDALSSFDLVGGWFDKETLNDPFTRSWRDPETAHQLVRPHGWLESFISANCGFHRRVFDSIGGWNEAYASGEDVEFSWRAQLAGFTLGFAPDACVQYRYRTSISALVRQNFFRAQSSPLLQRDFRERGLEPEPAPHRAVGRIEWLVGNIPAAVVDRSVRRKWIATLAHSAGWVVAQVRN
jgi:GT2 family glycosyltransferase